MGVKNSSIPLAISKRKKVSRTTNGFCPKLTSTGAETNSTGVQQKSFFSMVCHVKNLTRKRVIVTNDQLWSLWF